MPQLAETFQECAIAILVMCKQGHELPQTFYFAEHTHTHNLFKNNSGSITKIQ